MKPIGPVALIADVRHDDRRHAGRHDGVRRSGATVVHDEAPLAETGPDGRRPRCSSGSATRRLRSIDPWTTTRRPASSRRSTAARSSAGGMPRIDPNVMTIGGWPIGQERRELRGERVRRRAVDPRPGDRRPGRQVGRHADDRRGAGHDVQPAASAPGRAPARAARCRRGPGDRRAAGRSAPGAVEHPPREAVRRPEARHSGRRRRVRSAAGPGRRPPSPSAAPRPARRRAPARGCRGAGRGRGRAAARAAAGQCASPSARWKSRSTATWSHRSVRRRLGGRRLDPSRIGVRSGHLDAARPAARARRGAPAS